MVRRMAASLRIPARPEPYVCTCPPAYGGPHPVPGSHAQEVDLYRRVSMVKAKDRARGVEEVAVERQTWETCAMCYRMGVRIVRMWTDNDISATNGAYRPAFEGILLDDDTRVVVTYHTDRFVRLNREMQRVERRGLTVHGVHSSTLDLTTPYGVATAVTQTAFAEAEGKLKAQRQRSKNRQQAAAGEPRWWIRTPFGYNPDGTLNAVQAAALRTVYDNILLGGKFSAQVKWLNGQGLISNTGKKWAHGSLRHVVTSPRNAGIRTYTTTLHKGTDREKVETVEIGKGSWTPIVSEETYRAVVAMLKDPSRFSGGPRTGKDPLYLLTGIAKCGVCGGGVHSNQSGEKKFRYYRCRNKFCVNHRVEVADSQVITKVIELLQDKEYQHAWQEETFDAQPALIEKAQIKARLDEMAEDWMLGKITREQMHRATAISEKRLAELDNLLIASGSSEPIAKLISDLDYVWQEFDKMLVDTVHLDRARQIVQTTCKSITLLPRNRSRVPNPDHIVIEPRLPARQPSVSAA